MVGNAEGVTGSESAKGMMGFLTGNPAALRNRISAKESYANTHGGTILWSLDTAVYDRWQEIIDKNLHVASLVSQRMAMTVERFADITAEKETDRSVEMCDWMKRQLFGLDDGFGWTTRLKQMLFAVFAGFSVHENIWARGDDGRIGLARLKHCYNGQFVFDGECRIYLVGRGTNPIELPRRKFVVTRSGDPLLFDNPYGSGLLERLRFYDWMKRAVEGWWVQYLEIFGAPSIVAKYKAGTGEEEKLRGEIRTALQQIASTKGLIVPDTVEIDDLARVASQGRFSEYEKFIRYIEGKEAQLILGSTLTTAEAEFGTRAQAEVHEDTTEKRVDVDAKMLDEVINRGIIDPLLMLNFGDVPDDERPKYGTDTESAGDTEEDRKNHQMAYDMGVEIDEADFRTRFAIAPVANGGAVIKKTDASPPSPSPTGGGGASMSEPPCGCAEFADTGGSQKKNQFVTPLARKLSARREEIADSYLRDRFAKNVRGLLDQHFDQIAGFVDQGASLSVAVESNPFQIPTDWLPNDLADLAFGAWALSWTDLDAIWMEQTGSVVPRQARATTTDPAQFREPLDDEFDDYRQALQWFVSRDAISQEDAEAMIARIRDSGMTAEQASSYVRARALWFSGNASAEVAGMIQAALAKAVSEGIGFKEWRDSILSSIPADELPGAGAMARLETIYRTETARIYSEQREVLYRDPDVRQFLAGFDWYNPDDERTRPDHAALIGFIPINSGEASETPPLDFNCRCEKYPVVREEGRDYPDRPDLEESFAAASRFPSE